MSQSVLLITCSAGHGHTIATENIKKRLLAENPNLNIITLDVSTYILAPLGSKINTFWDFNMRHGTRLMSFLPKLLVLTHYETFYEKFLANNLKKKITGILQENNIQTIYDAQPIFTNLMLNTLASTQAGKNCTYHKILTDLPTRLNQHFLPNIKRIQHKKNVEFKLHAQTPMESAGQSAADFWQQHCNLNTEQISSTFATPVNAEYLVIPKNNHNIAVNILAPLVKHYQLEYKNGQLHIPDNAKVTTLMLGSQGLCVIPDYVDAYIEQAKQKHVDTPHIFFVACSKNATLYEQLEQKILQKNIKQNLPNHLLIPLPMQDPSTIAYLMWRSQQAVIRPSGLSCLEQLAMAQTRKQSGIENSPKIWVHVPYNKTLPEFDTAAERDACLIKRSFGYERGNAEYLLAHLEAHLATPCSIKFS